MEIKFVPVLSTDGSHDCLPGRDQAADRARMIEDAERSATHRSTSADLSLDKSAEGTQKASSNVDLEDHDVERAVDRSIEDARRALTEEQFISIRVHDPLQDLDK